MMMMEHFWSGFEKQASRWDIAKGVAQGVALGGGIAAAHGALSNTEKAKETSRVRAEAHGQQAADAAKTRQENLAQYMLNPHTPGPLSEVGHRLRRRHQAAKAEHPYKTALIPGYGMIAGGSAGKQHVE
jgi:hypothetical protein